VEGDEYEQYDRIIIKKPNIYGYLDLLYICSYWEPIGLYIYL